MPTTLLFTIFLLLSSGQPATKAIFQCSGIQGFAAGDDEGGGTPIENPILILDSRGSTVLEAEDGTVIYCTATQGEESWEGNIVLHKPRMTLFLGII